MGILVKEKMLRVFLIDVTCTMFVLGFTALATSLNTHAFEAIHHVLVMCVRRFEEEDHG